MKIIKYNVLGYMSTYNTETEKVEDIECLCGVKRPHSEANEELAKKEAYNGEYIIEEVDDSYFEGGILNV